MGIYISKLINRCALRHSTYMYHLHDKEEQQPTCSQSYLFQKIQSSNNNYNNNNNWRARKKIFGGWKSPCYQKDTNSRLTRDRTHASRTYVLAHMSISLLRSCLRSTYTDMHVRMIRPSVQDCNKSVLFLLLPKDFDLLSSYRRAFKESKRGRWKRYLFSIHACMHACM